MTKIEKAVDEACRAQNEAREEIRTALEMRFPDGQRKGAYSLRLANRLSSAYSWLTTGRGENCSHPKDAGELRYVTSGAKEAIRILARVEQQLPAEVAAIVSKALKRAERAQNLRDASQRGLL